MAEELKTSKIETQLALQKQTIDGMSREISEIKQGLTEQTRGMTSLLEKNIGIMQAFIEKSLQTKVSIEKFDAGMLAVYKEIAKVEAAADAKIKSVDEKADDSKDAIKWVIMTVGGAILVAALGKIFLF